MEIPNASDKEPILKDLRASVNANLCRILDLEENVKALRDTQDDFATRVSGRIEELIERMDFVQGKSTAGRDWGDGVSPGVVPVAVKIYEDGSATVEMSDGEKRRVPAYNVDVPSPFTQLREMVDEMEAGWEDLS